MDINSIHFGYNQPMGGQAQVNPKFLQALESKGFHRPVRSLSDPRVRLPELLLMEGWDREANEKGVTYSAHAENDPDYGQQITFFGDNAREIRTFAEKAAYVLKVDAQGRVQEYKITDRRY